MPTVTDYTALLSGSYWNGIEVTGSPVIVTYSFPTSLPAYDASVGGFTAATLGSFSAFSAAEQTETIGALNQWASASGLIFIQVAPGEGDINFQNVDFNTTSGPSYAGAGGIGFYPFGNWNYFSYPYFSGDLDSSGDVFMNSQYQNADGTVNLGTLLHEIGHAIGLKHPTEVVTDYAANPAVVHDQVLSSDDPTRTIMATVGDGSAGATSLFTLDQQAAAALYGPAGTGGVYTGSASGSNSVSNWSWDATTETLTQTAVSVGEAIRGSSVNDVITGSSGDDSLFGLDGTNILYGLDGNDKLYDGPGTNTLVGGIGDDSYYVTNSATTIVENAGEGYDSVYSTVSYTLSANIETLSLFGAGLTGVGNDQGDSLFGDGSAATTLIGGAGADYIVGGTGDDTIQGHGGGDVMWGGGGADTFIFRTLGEVSVSAALNTIGDFTAGQDKIDLSGVAESTGQALTFSASSMFDNQAGEVIQVVSGSNTFIEGDINGDGTADFQILLYGTPALQATDFVMTAPQCYRAGTRILTDRGEIAVEDLEVGARAVTASGEAKPIIWIGYRPIDCNRYPDPRVVWPIRVRAGTFGDAMPHRDLWLSPDHAVFVDSVLIPIKHLINGASIAQIPVETVLYYHVELERHDVLLAEGLPAESYLDTGSRGTFVNNGGPIDLLPRFDGPKTWTDDAAAPLACDEPRVKPVWERLAARSSALGFPVVLPELTTDPEPLLQIGADVLAPVTGGQHRYRFVPGGRVGPIRLLSRSGYPTDARPWADDWRRLGVYVSRIVWYDADGPHDVAVDDPALTDGWWDVERDGPLLRRWTNGNARLPMMPAVRMVEIHLAGGMSYPIEPNAGAQDLAA